MPEPALKMERTLNVYICHRWHVEHAAKSDTDALYNMHSMSKNKCLTVLMVLNKRSSSRAYDHGRDAPGRVKVGLSRVESHDSTLMKPEICAREGSRREAMRCDGSACAFTSAYVQSKAQRVAVDPPCSS